MDDREKAAEELAIKSHDKELLQKLRQSLGLSVRLEGGAAHLPSFHSISRFFGGGGCAQEEQQIPDSVVTQVKSINPFASMQKPQATTQTQAPNRNEPITRHVLHASSFFFLQAPYRGLVSFFLISVGDTPPKELSSRISRLRC